MKQSVLLALTGGALLLAACQRAETPAQEGNLVTVSASISEQTKAFFNGEGKFSWVEGDAIGVFVEGNEEGAFTEFTLKEIASDGTAVFAASLPEGAKVVGPAVYPYSTSSRYEGEGNVKVNLPMSYNPWDEKTVKAPMVSPLSETGTLSFKHVGGLIKIPVENVIQNGSILRLQSNTTRINGNFTVNANAAEPAIVTDAASTDDDKKVTFYFESKAYSGVGKVLYVPVPTGTYTNMDLKVYRSDWSGTVTRNSTSTKTVGRAQMLVFPPVSFGFSMANFESGTLPANLAGDNAYTGTQFQIVDNPHKSDYNRSAKVLLEDQTEYSDPKGYFSFNTQNSYYTNGFKDGSKAVSMKILYKEASDASLYVPAINFMTPKVRQTPDYVNGEAFEPKTAERWAALIRPGEWNSLVYQTNWSAGEWQLQIRPMLTIEDNGTTSGSKQIYIDDIELLK